MSFSILFRDELQGLYRSKAMLALLVGLPALIVILYIVYPDTSGMPMTAFSALIASSLAGTIAAVMVAVGIINEKNKKVYDLFLVRPVKESHLMLSKFMAAFIFVTLAVILSIGVGMVTDVYKGNALNGEALTWLARSLAMSISMIAVASAVGVVIGAAISSILVGVILVLYGGNQLVGVVAMLSMDISQNIFVQMLPAVVITTVLLVVAVEVFKRKRQ
jgi:ABC-type transport system involved in multi-copper enzyme maturation permease subunit